MEEENLFKEINSEIAELKEEDKKRKKKLLGIILSIALLFIFLLIIIIIIVVSDKGDKEENNDSDGDNNEYIGEIKCIYDIQTISKTTTLISNDYKKEAYFDIYIDNTKIKYSKEYKFSSIGNHEVKMKLYKDLDMDYMFKDIQVIISVEMNSEKNCKITSMISSFENCKNLKNFAINGFNGDNLLSLKKLFFNTGLISFNFHYDFTSNVEDISYMFYSTNINEFYFNSFDMNKVTNMSHMFEDCSSLLRVDFNDINCNNV